MARTMTCLRKTAVAALLLWTFSIICMLPYFEKLGQTNSKEEQNVMDSQKGPPGNDGARFLQLLHKQSTYTKQKHKHTTHNKNLKHQGEEVRKKISNQTELSNLGYIIGEQTIRAMIPNYPDMEVIQQLFTTIQLSNLGHNGGGVVLNKNKFPTSERKKMEDAEHEHGFNEYLSNLLPLNRILPNISPEPCGNVLYNIDLPKASVVICFVNESLSALLRTVHSVINTSPEHLLEEIILVDDFSEKHYLKTLLDEYVSKLRNVTIIRTKRREGLIRARLLGFEAARAPVVIYLDSHCECFPGWFEPLVGRIAQNETNVPTPVIQVIDHSTMSVSFNSPVHVGFLLFPHLSFDWMEIPKREKRRWKSAADPIRSPAMAGGLFAISKRFFERIGTYDPDLETWGGENAELSLKTWMCGGAIEMLPCSNVGHIYRMHSNYKADESVKYIYHNTARVAQVWLDSYKKYVPNINGDIVDFGNVSQRIQLRKRLKCHSFQWYIDNVHPEAYIRGEGVLTGEIRSKAQPHKCIQWENIDNKQILTLKSCDTKDNFSWDFTDLEEIKFSGYSCWDIGMKLGQVLLNRCHYGQGNQQWEYVNGMLRSSGSKECLSVDGSSDLRMEQCLGKENQEWIWHKHRTQRSLD